MMLLLISLLLKWKDMMGHSADNELAVAVMPQGIEHRAFLHNLLPLGILNPPHLDAAIPWDALDMEKSVPVLAFNNMPPSACPRSLWLILKHPSPSARRTF